ncbi:MAG: GYDIA family GHMP kinase [Bacteroidota bacterium]
MADTAFHAKGKLLLTGEYAVLDGAEALAIPTQLGQQLEIISELSGQADHLSWRSYDVDEQCWFDAKFDVQSGNCLESTDATIAERLVQLFQIILKKQPNFLSNYQGDQINTQLEFPRLWGLGTSSTLVHLLSQWAAVNPFELQFAVFGGSGYDIACAGAKQSILYQKLNGKSIFQEVDFKPDFLDQLYFIYLDKKQDSRKGIAHYRQNSQQQAQLIPQITALTQAFLAASTLQEAEQILLTHERLIADTLKMERVQSLYFRDYWGVIKSLGAWGGDFVLATSRRSVEETKTYFQDRGFHTFFKYEDLLL